MHLLNGSHAPKIKLINPQNHSINVGDYRHDHSLVKSFERAKIKFVKYKYGVSFRNVNSTPR